MLYTLCVIDMQDYFAAAHRNGVRKACIREIKKAMRNNAAILFVEYNNYGPTIELLTNLTKSAKYKKTYHVIKYCDGGGYEVTEFIKKNHLPKLNIRVCGVNTDYCVLATVLGINRRWQDTKIHVVADACDSTDSHKDGLRVLANMHPNVRLLRSKG
jgi:nicotinamidase-related amidase